MTFEGRQWLYRIELRCAGFWGVSLLDSNGRPNLYKQPFGPMTWRDAMWIVRNLRMGYSNPEKGARI